MHGEEEGDKNIKLIKKILVITFTFFFPINPVKSVSLYVELYFIDSCLAGILPLFINAFVKKDNDSSITCCETHRENLINCPL